ncbi:MAG: GNAT family N-acetyltransferase [Verrucomicrobiae bacterium]|nr:GNAT family N-acetyltransferase [Verrucomicrobiae bacterium]
MLSALFAEAYQPPTGGDAREHYPFPQLLDEHWVAAHVERPEFCWIVAEVGGKVVGTVGAVRNVGTDRDRVTEGFGLVVGERARGKGIGTELMKRLYEEVASQAHYFIAETRTAEAGGWKCVQRSGFIPTGFEPFAHLTPAGKEAMLLTARVSPEALRRRSPSARITRLVRPLAEAVLRVAFQQTSPLSNGSQTREGFRTSLPSNADESAQSHGIETVPAANCEVTRDDDASQHYLETWDPARPHAAGVVCLRRMEGCLGNSDRYDRRCFVVRIAGQVASAARVVWDRRDCRARILDLKSQQEGLQGMLIASIVEELTREASGSHLTIVLDVHTGNPRLMATMEALGFFPTAYYPALVAIGSERYDAVQYTRLCHRGEFLDSVDKVCSIEWAAAKNVIQCINGIVTSSDPHAAQSCGEH